MADGDFPEGASARIIFKMVELNGVPTTQVTVEWDEELTNHFEGRAALFAAIQAYEWVVNTGGEFGVKIPATTSDEGLAHLQKQLTDRAKRMSALLGIDPMTGEPTTED